MYIQQKINDGKPFWSSKYKNNGYNVNEKWKLIFFGQKADEITIGHGI